MLECLSAVQLNWTFYTLTVHLNARGQGSTEFALYRYHIFPSEDIVQQDIVMQSYYLALP